MYSAWLQEMAWVRNDYFVDVRTNLNRITREQRKKQDEFTLIPDGVHPNAAGLAVVATDIIKQLLGADYLSEIHLNLNGNGLYDRDVKGGRIDDLEISEIEMSFDFLPESLPWIIPENARNGVDLGKGKRFNTELLSISGLSEGYYTIYEDARAITRISAAQLAGGVDLNDYYSATHFEQSTAIAALNEKRNQELFKLRELWYHKKALPEKKMLLDANPGNRDLLREVKGLKKLVADFCQREQELLKRAMAFQAEIEHINKPVKRHYKVIRDYK